MIESLNAIRNNGRRREGKASRLNWQKKKVKTDSAITVIDYDNQRQAIHWLT